MFDRLVSVDWSLGTVYVLCAAVGGLVLVVQTLLLLLGVGADLGVDAGGAEVGLDDGDGSFGVLSVRSVSAFLTFFGLAGWASLAAGWGSAASLGFASLAGLAIMLVVAWLVHLQLKLQSRGNIDPSGAIGRTATVYLRVPAQRSGQGKITVALQGRSVEFPAVTNGTEIPTGGAVRILSMPTPGVFEVAPLHED